MAGVMTDLFLLNREIGVDVIGDRDVSRAGDTNAIVASMYEALPANPIGDLRFITWLTEPPVKNRVEDRLPRQVTK